jgi:diguanylate cyclase (GGDEF)-like protein/PAS domain S-box-containing protein
VARSRLRRPPATLTVDGPLSQYRRLIESLTDYAIFTLAADGRIDSWNAGAREAFGYTDDEVIGRHYGLIFTPEDRANGLPEAELRAARHAGKAAIDGWHVRKDGSKFWCTNTVQPFKDELGAICGFTKIVRDSTEQHEAALALRASEERLRLLIDGATEYAIFSLSDRGNITSWNAGAAEIFGYTEGEILGKPFSLLYTVEAVAKGLPDGELLAAARSGRAENNGWHVRKNGTRFFGSGHTSRLSPDEAGEARGFVKICHDSTARNDLEEQMRRRALHDELTALPNRASFGDYLSRSVAQAQNQAGIAYAVLYLDLDKFKDINDRLGHGAGDELLVGFARLLERCSRPGDIVSRAGGDEFTVLLTNITSVRDAVSVAARIALALREPLSLRGWKITVTASIGIAVGSSSYTAAEDILRDADSAMYRAKALGGAQHAVFSPLEPLPPVLTPA